MLNVRVDHYILLLLTNESYHRQVRARKAALTERSAFHTTELDGSQVGGFCRQGTVPRWSANPQELPEVCQAIRQNDIVGISKKLE